ncbi:sucrose-6-phosphate hydrolase [Paenibacillus polygoni]|uniref:Sucrose-6-phosphate hydrolase n=1 Tax=Paenibacillus polygoni TaxID=3050112 RepID=A0ABY8WZN1_9BACL|nr:sucrose-6-phosphate hydrolase [Paenibacillus polygoni]WIV17184.1 sucrose-6-phosphate hydrolase [Paenibacillus polygoni]
MEITREEKYRKLEQAYPGEVESLTALVGKSPWRQLFHIQPPTGLLNDPNGFTFFQGEYHLFYQWFPLGTYHGMKYWYHTKSMDLAHWENVGIGIEPGGPYDSHGAYSGSGIVKDDKLYLMYTGNSRDENWVRHSYQNLAVMDTEGEIIKRSSPVIDSVPDGYTEHFRDPKVWESEGSYYCLIGAQRTNVTGCAVMYRSPNLIDWTFEGEMVTKLDHFGYMWECPDYFEMDDQGVFLFSPQGLSPEEDAFNNIYQSGYLIGEKLDVSTRLFDHGPFQELDRGFDFYAQQTTKAPDGRRILVGWMGIPESNYPTDNQGWANCLTLPRELILKEDKIIQRPVRELEQLRKEQSEVKSLLRDETRTFPNFTGTTYELICEFTNENAQQFGVEFRAGENEKTVLCYDHLNKKVILDRSMSGEPIESAYGNVRRCRLEADKVKFQLFVDTSSVEVFVNDGEEVFTSRIFPSEDSTEIRFFSSGGVVSLEASLWRI